MCEFIGTMPTTTGNTFSDFPPEEFTILAFCDSCGHQSAVDRSSVPEDSVIQELPGRLRCSACGSRDCSIRIVFTGAGLARVQDSAGVPALAVNGKRKE